MKANGVQKKVWSIGLKIVHGQSEDSFFSINEYWLVLTLTSHNLNRNVYVKLKCRVCCQWKPICLLKMQFYFRPQDLATGGRTCIEQLLDWNCVVSIFYSLYTHWYNAAYCSHFKELFLNDFFLPVLRWSNGRPKNGHLLHNEWVHIPEFCRSHQQFHWHQPGLQPQEEGQHHRIPVRELPIV